MLDSRGPAVQAQAKEFLAEAVIQAPLDHPAICNLTGVCTTQSPFLVIFEFAPYGDLQGLLKGCAEKKLTLHYAEQLDIGLQIAEGILDLGLIFHY